MASNKKIEENKGMEVILITRHETKLEKYENSKQAYEVFEKILNYEKYELRHKEHFWVMGINNEGFIVCIYIVALGSGEQIKMTAAEILDIAVGLKSRRIILAHNHPSGDVRPSKNDILTTNMLYHSCMPFGIEIVDHLIIAVGKYSSFEEMGKMKKIKADKTFKQFDEGFSEGAERGIKEGLKDGIQKGKIEGKKEGKYEQKIVIAKKMLKENIDINIITKITKLTKKEIEKLK